MKIKTLISVFILSLFITAVPIFAKNEATTTPRTIRNQIREEIQETKITITEAKQKRIQVIYDAIKMGLEKRHASLLKIKAKLEARITKNPMKKDTSTAVNKLKEFDVVEALYIKDLATFDAKFTEIKSSTTKISQLVAELKTAAEAVRKDLKDIKKILREAVVLLAQSPKLEVTKTE
jgi:hypothetical protein